MASVTFENVCKRYGNDIWAVRDFSLTIEDKEFVVFVGPSGCGKTTTLRMVAGLEEVTSGIIRIGERIVNDVPPKDRDVAMVFQNYALYPHMTVYENMAFGLQLRRVPKREIQKRIETAASSLGIAHLLDRLPKALSGGQRQRVALGRAIVREPSVFLFDEPLSNVDAKMRVEMRAELVRLHQRVQRTMIYVTHDQIEAMTLGDRIVVMNDGRIMQVATPLDVYRSPANTFVARFIGTPPMNLLKGILRTEGSQWFFEAEGLRVALSDDFSRNAHDYVNKDVYLGVRPEDMELGDGRGEQVGSIWPSRVDVVETLGNEVIIHFDAARQRFQVRADPYHPLLHRTEHEVVCKLDRAHLFDVHTGRNITANAECVTAQ